MAISNGEGIVPAREAKGNLKVLEAARKGFASGISQLSNFDITKVVGQGTGTSDSIKTDLAEGDFVIPAGVMRTLDSRRQNARVGGVISGIGQTVKQDTGRAVGLAAGVGFAASSVDTSSAESFKDSLANAGLILAFQAKEIKDFTNEVKANAQAAQKATTATKAQPLAGPRTDLKNIKALQKGASAGNLGTVAKLASQDDFASAAAKTRGEFSAKSQGITSAADKQLADANRGLQDARNREAKASRNFTKAVDNQTKQRAVVGKAQKDLATAEKTLAKRLAAESSLENKLSKARAKKLALENKINAGLAKNSDDLVKTQKALQKATSTVDKLSSRLVDSRSGVRAARGAVGAAETRLVDRSMQGLLKIQTI